MNRCTINVSGALLNFNDCFFIFPNVAKLTNIKIENKRKIVLTPIQVINIPVDRADDILINDSRIVLNLLLYRYIQLKY